MWTILRGSKLKPIEKLHLLKLRFKYNHPTLLTQFKIGNFSVILIYAWMCVKSYTPRKMTSGS